MGDMVNASWQMEKKESSHDRVVTNACSIANVMLGEEMMYGR